MKPAEVRVNEEAQKAMQREWDRLRQVERPDGKLGVWEETAVMEWRDVGKLARQ